METSHSVQTRNVTQAQADDFQVINGIGQAIEKRLYNAGILTYANLASQTPEDILKSIGKMIGLTRERILNQDWIGQARELASKGVEAEGDYGELGTKGRLHYEVFTVELLLDEENVARRTRVMHIQSQKENTWAGWERGRLERLFIELANLQALPTDESFDRELSYESNQPLAEEAERLGQRNKLRGDLQISEMDIKSHKHHVINHNTPFSIVLTLDLSHIYAPEDVRLAYTVTVNAKRLNDGAHQTIGTAEGTIQQTDDHTYPIAVEIPGMPEGLYRTETIVTLDLTTDGAEEMGSRLHTMSEGELILIN